MTTYIAMYLAIGFACSIWYGVHTIVYDKKHYEIGFAVSLIVIWPLVLVAFLQMIMIKNIAEYITERQKHD